MATRKPDLFETAGDLKEKIPLPELKIKSAWAHVLSARQMRQARAAAQVDGETDDEALTAHVVALSLRDGRGERVVPEGRESEFHDLPAPVVTRIVEKVFDVCGLGGAAEDIEGN